MKQSLNIDLKINGRLRQVVCAAVKIKNRIFLGARHYDTIMDSQIDLLPFDGENSEGDGIEGFIDQWGNFLTRKEAMYIAVNNGQPIDFVRNRSRTELYSEGLY